MAETTAQTHASDGNKFMTLNEYQEKTVDKKAADAEGRLYHDIMQLGHMAGSIEPLFKKGLYEGRGEMDPFDRVEMIEKLGSVLLYVSRCAAGIHVSLESVAQVNMANLARKGSL